MFNFFVEEKFNEKIETVKIKNTSDYKITKKMLYTVFLLTYLPCYDIISLYFLALFGLFVPTEPNKM